MSSFDHPLGILQEVHVQKIGIYSDSLGVFYEVFTKEGHIILVGDTASGPTVEVQGYKPYGGPQAERVLHDIKAMLEEQGGYAPAGPSHSEPELLN